MARRYETIQDLLGLNDDYSKPEYTRSPMEEGMYMPEEPFTRAQNYVVAPPGGEEEAVAAVAPQPLKRKRQAGPEAVFRVGAVSDGGEDAINKYMGVLTGAGASPNNVNVRPPLPPIPPALRALRGQGIRSPFEEITTPDTGPVPANVSAVAAAPSGEAKAAPAAAMGTPEKPKQSGPPPLPQDLLERLRAARRDDSINFGTSSLGRLLMATSAQFGHDKSAPGLMEDYLNYQAKGDNASVGTMKLEEELKENERKNARDDAEAKLKRVETLKKQMAADEELSTTSPKAKLTQRLATELGLAPEEVVNMPAGMYDEVAKLHSSISDRTNKREMADAANAVRESMAAAQRAMTLAIAGMNEAGRNSRFDRGNEEQMNRLKFQAEEMARRLGITNEEAMKRLMLQLEAKATSDDKRIDAKAEDTDKRIDAQKEIADKRIQAAAEAAKKKEERAAANRDEAQRKMLSAKVSGDVQVVTNAINELAAIKKKYGGYPGVGMLRGAFPAISKEAKHVRMLAEQIATKWRHDIYGASLTGYELPRAEKATGAVKGGSSQDEFEWGLKYLNDLNTQHLTKTFAGVGNDVVLGKWQTDTGIYIPGHPRFGASGTATEAYLKSLKAPAAAAPPEDDLEAAPLVP